MARFSGSSDRNPTLSRYFSEIRNYPILTREEEMGLGKRIEKGHRQPRNKLVESNLSFVVKVASEYRHLGIPFEDLLNEGNIGLIEAAHRYDHRKGTKFITYAIWWIRKSILKALSEQSNLVRVPNYQMKKVRAVRNTEKALRGSLGRAPGRDEISTELESTVAKVDQILQFNLKEISIDARVGRERDTPLSDYLVDDSVSSPEDSLITKENKSLIRNALSVLNGQEQHVIVQRYGFGTGKTRTLKEIGADMGISRERVRQIEVQAKERLRRYLGRNKAALAPTRREGVVPEKRGGARLSLLEH
ncbi:MAG: RNA polymerase sigma factor RpoD/SigA [Acidobacteria bacterium]|nr:RNA polymerase sigma factor RpoD/SigA [Acidobacteriota bacterium]MCZ6746725.1 RNA polymerase sigma factor RpoD/SigA [Acidobacteriota bacterium]MCZ6832813.1 RNA polymerase sigma factor RpoD/SigA [Acidobacteriota bacterium]